MSGTKAKIALIAESISCTYYSIIYKVSFAGQFDFGKTEGIVVCDNNIKDKDLILKSTYLDKKNMEVIFTPSNPTPLFYQKLMDNKLKENDEYESELRNIYAVGDIVGYVVC